MSAPEPRMRWWGWGEEGHDAGVPPAGAALLEAELGASRATPRVALEQVELPDSRLPAEARRRLEAIVGAEHVRDDRLRRVAHATGRSYPDLLRLRSGDASGAPDAVVYPGRSEEVAQVLAECSSAGIACVPFGGGTSVVGGVEPRREGFAAAISLDLARMDRLLEVDRTSLSARLEPGLTGPQAERELGRHGLTLGHFPQSFEYATVGGFVATRSAGQASTGFGRIDELVLGLRLVSPAGELVAKAVPATAAGPALRELVVGSEGVLGVIVEATLSVRPVPAARRYEAWSVRDFETGAEALRSLEQAGAAPDVARLSDEEETRIAMAQAAASGGTLAALTRRAVGSYLRARGHGRGCIAVIGFEGPRADVARRRARAARVLRAAGAVSLGQRPGRSWRRGRYEAPYLRDALLDRGLLVETLETATTWSRLPALHRDVGDALRAALEDDGSRAIVMCHVSHLYPSGASLYFTFLAPRRAGAELEQWRAAKGAASEAIVAGGGTITHHHAVGSDHAPWMEAEVGELGLDLLRTAKRRLDPEGVMNPGKLLPEAGRPARD